MTVSAIARPTSTHRGAYDRYQAEFMDVCTAHPHTLPAADEAPRLVEGRWDRDNPVRGLP